MQSMPNPKRQLRHHLNADALLATLRQRFASLEDARLAPSYSLADTLMAGLALFALKDPSLLAFDKRRQDPNSNLRTIYGIDRVPCDSQLRDILDTVDPNTLRPCFTDLFRHLQRGKALEPFVFYEGYYLLAFDGSQYFSSDTVHCPHCLEKHHRNGTTTYHHQMLGAVLVHPDHREVIPLMPEPIVKQDGTCKNDCERNAAKRFFPAFRKEHPHLPVIALADGLSANAPQLRELQAHNIRFLLVANPGDHTFLFKQLEAAFTEGRAEVLTVWDAQTNTLCHYRWLHGVPLNEANQEVLVNVLEYWEIRDGKVVYSGSWVTDLEVRADNVQLLVRGARTRWKIENETFNTLKNQGYHYEHNFGHGVQHLSVVLAVLMLLAFLVDQMQQLCCPLFAAAWVKAGSKRQLWDEMRHLFHAFVFQTMAALWEALVRGIDKQTPVLLDDS
jgi:hypothetical protein